VRAADEVLAARWQRGWIARRAQRAVAVDVRRVVVATAAVGAEVADLTAGRAREERGQQGEGGESGMRTEGEAQHAWM
jgi:hypothetical protein